MYGIRVHVHLPQTLSTATHGTRSLGTDAANYQSFGRTGPASASALAACGWSFAAADSSADRDEPAPHSTLEKELAKARTGRSVGRTAFGTPQKVDGREGGRHPCAHRRPSARTVHALVHASSGSTFGLEQRHDHACLAQGRAATASTAAVHGQPGPQL